MEDIIFCAVIGVDCIENDSDAIENGESKYIGYVFNVRSEMADYMIGFIKQKLEEFNVPYKDVYVFKRMSLSAVMVQNAKDIAEEIERTANFFIKKSQSNENQK